MSKVKVVKEDENGNVALNCPICNKRLFNDADAKKDPMAFNPCKHVAFMGDQEGFDGISKKMRKVVENVRAEICDDCGDADDKDVIKALKKMYPTLVECRVDHGYIGGCQYGLTRLFFLNND